MSKLSDVVGIKQLCEFFEALKQRLKERKRLRERRERFAEFREELKARRERTPIRGGPSLSELGWHKQRHPSTGGYRPPRFENDLDPDGKPTSPYAQ